MSVSVSEQQGGPMVNRWPRTQASQGSRAGWLAQLFSPIQEIPHQVQIYLSGFGFYFFLNPNPTSQPTSSSSTSSSAPQPIPVLMALCHRVPSLRLTFQLLPTSFRTQTQCFLSTAALTTHHPLKARWFVHSTRILAPSMRFGTTWRWK